MAGPASAGNYSLIFIYQKEMSSLVVGCRVVRGPDWKWGDQDGGEGYAGTSVPTSPADLKLLGPRTVTVAWDIGTKFNYQGGPEGFHDLRVGPFTLTINLK